MSSGKKRLFLIGVIGLGILVLLWIISLLSPQREIPEGMNPTPTPVGFQQDGGRDIVAITRINPSPNTKNADYTGTITITFGSPITASTSRLSLTPSISGVITQESPTTIVFKPAKTLQPATRYTARFSVPGIALITPQNTKVTSYTWSFTTDGVSGEEAFTPEDIKAFQEIRKQADSAYQRRKQQFPFLTSLPYTTNHFRIDITTSDIVVITTYGTTQAETQAYRDQALAWLRSNGGNPATLQIQYQSETR
jgi:hypothetical protein